jgi:uncharacterized protein (DUF4213/DUF364 family)
LSKLLHELLSSLTEAEVVRVLIGLHWTAVVAERADGLSCGLASTLSGSCSHHGEPAISGAGKLETMSAASLAALAGSEMPLRASVGIAAINALLPKRHSSFVDLNAERVIAEQGQGKKVALIGHFPFVERLKNQVGELFVIEQQPRPGDYPSSAAAEILPKVQVAAITGTSLINHTLDDLLAIIPSTTLVILLGPSTPLSPILFDYGIDILCGSVVVSFDEVLKVVEQGGNFRQVRRAGVRTVTMARSEFN